MKKVQIKKISIAIVILASFVFYCILVPDTMSYFTDHHTVMNEFTTGKVTISIDEPKYNLQENVEARKHISPREIIIKDPVVTNTGKSDCYIFAEVEIPKETYTRVDDSGQKVTPSPVLQDLYTYEVNPEWIIVNDYVTPTSHVRVYGYTSGGAMKVMHTGEKTTVLMKGSVMNAPNFIELENPLSTKDIPVRAYGIQTTDIGGNDGTVTDPVEIWKIVKNQEYAEEISGVKKSRI